MLRVRALLLGAGAEDRFVMEKARSEYFEVSLETANETSARLFQRSMRPALHSRAARSCVQRLLGDCGNRVRL